MIFFDMILRLFSVATKMSLVTLWNSCHFLNQNVLKRFKIISSIFPHYNNLRYNTIFTEYWFIIHYNE